MSTDTAFIHNCSGGERSFTTLALLLALGERLETPFRVMDEFDVFLDPMARRIALHTLVSRRDLEFSLRYQPSFSRPRSGGSCQGYGASSIHIHHAAGRELTHTRSQSQDNTHEGSETKC